jgi:MFS family permease
MKTRTDDRLGRIVLMTSHCAGMVDMVALPLWVGTLIARYGLDPRAAGGLVTIFLLGAVTASLVFAPRFDKHVGRRMASLGFGLGALCFFGAAQIQPQTPQFAAMAVLHGLGGLAVGCGLSFTHGTMGRSSNPHRLFGLAGAVLGVFALGFLGLTPKVLESFGGQALFLALGGVMVVAALLAAWAFPVAQETQEAATAARGAGQRIPLVAWAGVLGVSCMALVQALVFSFVERMGMDRGFGLGAVTAILVGMGVVNMFPSALAALFERQLSATAVLTIGPIVQAALAYTIANSHTLAPFAAAASVFVATMLFTHTFAFGALARVDPTGRCVAATAAMVMIGSAIGPVLGGTLGQTAGYGAIGIAALIIDAIALASFGLMSSGIAAGAPAAPGLGEAAKRASPSSPRAAQ